MKNFIFTMMAVVLTLNIVGCSNNDDETEGKEQISEKNVVIRIGGMQVRAAATGEAIGTKKAILNDGYIVFTTSGGGITKIVQFSTGGTITPAMLDAGYTFSNIPGNSTQVAIYGNIPPAIPLPAGGSIATLNALLINVATQADVSEGVDRVTLYGGSAIGGTAPDYTATFNIAPIAARIEIADVIPDPASKLISFKVEAIFINNYFLTSQIDGNKNTEVDNGLVNNGMGGSTIYSDGVAPYISGFPLYNSDVTAGLTPAAPKVWAYNVFAPANNTTEHTHVILRLSNIVASEGSYPGVQFVTIKKFRTKDETPVVLNFLTAGRVYELGTVKIKETDIQEEAEIGEIDVVIDVNVVSWVPVPVNPEI